MSKSLSFVLLALVAWARHLPAQAAADQPADVAVADASRPSRPPRDLVFSGVASGGAGPDLAVRVEWVDSAHLAFTVTRDGRQYQRVVDRAQAGRFHVISQGADGERGSDGASGRDGLSGTMGSMAMCPSGQGGDGGRGEDGEAGQDGRAGGDGGRGGTIAVEVVPGGGNADELLAIVRRSVLSRGGSGGFGGSGGQGGRGGQGGQGGFGTTCVQGDGTVVMLAGGSQGASGTDGRSGIPGFAGAPGARGQVTVRIVP